MEQGFSGNTPSERIRNRLVWIHEVGGDTIGGAFRLQLIESDETIGTFTFVARTDPWMRNVIGTLHGGSCAALADQAMGCVANCLFANEPHAPTSQLQLNFHRPLMAGEQLMVMVRIVNVSRSMIHLSAVITRKIAPEKPCVSSSSVFFRTSKTNGGNTNE